MTAAAAVIILDLRSTTEESAQAHLTGLETWINQQPVRLVSLNDLAADRADAVLLNGDSATKAVSA